MFSIFVSQVQIYLPTTVEKMLLLWKSFKGSVETILKMRREKSQDFHPTYKGITIQIKNRLVYISKAETSPQSVWTSSISSLHEMKVLVKIQQTETTTEIKYTVNYLPMYTTELNEKDNLGP